MVMLLAAPEAVAAPPAEVPVGLPVNLDPFTPCAAITPVAAVVDRTRVAVRGRVVAVAVRPWGAGTALEVALDDGTGGIVLAFLGRSRIAGIVSGCHLVAAGTVGRHRGRRILLNPLFWLAG